MRKTEFQPHPGRHPTIVGKALKAGTMTSDEVDEKLEEWGALDLCYPELAWFE